MYSFRSSLNTILMQTLQVASNHFNIIVVVKCVKICQKHLQWLSTLGDWFLTLIFSLVKGAHISILEGWTVLFPLPELPLGTSIDSIEWKYHTINKTILLAKINLKKEQESRFFSRRTGMQIMENGTLYIEDVNDEDSGNYSCTIIFHDRRMQIEQIYLEVLHGTFLFYFTHNSRSFLSLMVVW